MLSTKQNNAQASLLESIIVYILILSLVIGSVILLSKIRIDKNNKKQSSGTSTKSLVIEKEQN